MLNSRSFWGCSSASFHLFFVFTILLIVPSKVIALDAESVSDITALQSQLAWDGGKTLYVLQPKATNDLNFPPAELALGAENGAWQVPSFSKFRVLSEDQKFKYTVVSQSIPAGTQFSGPQLLNIGLVLSRPGTSDLQAVAHVKLIDVTPPQLELNLLSEQTPKTGPKGVPYFVAPVEVRIGGSSTDSVSPQLINVDDLAYTAPAEAGGSAIKLGDLVISDLGYRNISVKVKDNAGNEAVQELKFEIRSKPVFPTVAGWVDYGCEQNGSTSITVSGLLKLKAKNSPDAGKLEVYQESFLMQMFSQDGKPMGSFDFAPFADISNRAQVIEDHLSGIYIGMNFNAANYGASECPSRILFKAIGKDGDGAKWEIEQEMKTQVLGLQSPEINPKDPQDPNPGDDQLCTTIPVESSTSCTLVTTADTNVVCEWVSEFINEESENSEVVDAVGIQNRYLMIAGSALATPRSMSGDLSAFVRSTIETFHAPPFSAPQSSPAGGSAELRASKKTMIVSGQPKVIKAAGTFKVKLINNGCGCASCKIKASNQTAYFQASAQHSPSSASLPPGVVGSISGATAAGGVWLNTQCGPILEEAGAKVGSLAVGSSTTVESAPLGASFASIPDFATLEGVLNVPATQISVPTVASLPDCESVACESEANYATAAYLSVFVKNNYPLGEQQSEHSSSGSLEACGITVGGGSSHSQTTQCLKFIDASANAKIENGKIGFTLSPKAEGCGAGQEPPNNGQPFTVSEMTFGP